MRAKHSVRFRGELAAGLVSALAFAATAIQPRWMEFLFGVDPDAGSGLVEQAVVALLGLATLALLAAATRDFRHASMAADPG